MTQECSKCHHRALVKAFSKFRNLSDYSIEQFLGPVKGFGLIRIKDGDLQRKGIMRLIILSSATALSCLTYLAKTQGTTGRENRTQAHLVVVSSICPKSEPRYQRL